MGTIVNFNQGWNAGGRSIKWVDGDAEITFDPNPAEITDVFAGFSAGTDVKAITEQTHSFRFSRTSAGINSATVCERGMLKHSSGAYVDGDLFKIRRVEGVVTFWKNGALIYTSATPSTGRAFLVAAMYMGGDKL